MVRYLWVLLLTAVVGIPGAHAQYNASAGVNAPRVARDVVERKANGQVETKTVWEPAPADQFGNAAGSQHDLAVDGAFEGQTIAVLHFYTGEGFDFSLPKKALQEKGFGVYRWIGAPPSPDELEKGLAKACQLWIISGSAQLLNEGHLKVIRKFFDSGRGVYIWGDNAPYYADANYVARALLDAQMSGDIPGDRVVGVQKADRKQGLLPNHLLTTGLQHIYEGITIATIGPNSHLTPLIYGSADNLVAAIYDHGGKRAILDGGFTRLYMKWDTAGTGRYVKNAAAWLTNVERFGDAVVSADARNGQKGARAP